MEVNINFVLPNTKHPSSQANGKSIYDVGMELEEKYEIIENYVRTDLLSSDLIIELIKLYIYSDEKEQVLTRITEEIHQGIKDWILLNLGNYTTKRAEKGEYDINSPFYYNSGTPRNPFLDTFAYISNLQVEIEHGQ